MHQESVDIPNNVIITPSGKDATIYDNTYQSIIQISEDRLELNARDYTENIKSIPEISGWGGIIVSILLTLTTAEFQDTCFLTGYQLKILFFIISILLVSKIVEKAYSYFKYVLLCDDRAFNPKEFVMKCRKNKKKLGGNVDK